ncbi:hypothetical protein HXX76_001905 [Chlamydomonas incerta]|uniref:Rieske domain-containing protein n=1 Tax=Chlamydomonas incerta TaxID=51695 RepID=A0A835WA19_CHLIN|nr:hypothetical protein HXX76_001905 [Chlamydomonas incerta]|eukprot:KAG2443553.1 hypothetical protein HXX76_001905 [Chlamydomonas incerta]
MGSSLRPRASGVWPGTQCQLRRTAPCVRAACRSGRASYGTRPSGSGRRGWVGAPAAVSTTITTTTASTAATAAADIEREGAIAGAAAGTERQTAAAQAGTVDAPFIWTRHWWPLLPEAYLRADRPTPVTLLGVPLVVWRDGAGSWRVFKDQCPHRMAPLSEGRVEADGSLSCSYHGWRFQGSGACSRIPQALDAAAEAAACSSRRSCATAFPCKVEAGMLWVWPDESADASAAAAATPPVITNNLRSRGADIDAQWREWQAAQEGATTSAATSASASASSSSSSASGKDAAAKKGSKPPRRVDWFMRELPYSYEVLLENLLDPAHLPFSHHGLNPFLNRSAGGPMPMRPPKSADAAGGDAPASSDPASSSTSASSQTSTGASTSTSTGDATGAAAATVPRHWARETGPDSEFDFVGNISRDGSISLTAPHLITYTYRTGAGSDMLIELFATPVAPGRSRFFTPAVPPPPGAKRPPMPPLKQLNFKRVAAIASFILDPVVTYHRTMNTLLDGDSVFLHVQDELLRRIEAEADSASPTASAAATAATATAAAAAPAAPAASSADGNGSTSTNSTSTNGSSSSGSLWSRVYYLPTQADSAMLAGRRWLEERAGGGPFRARQRQLLAPSSSPSPTAASSGGAVEAALLPLISTGGAGPVVPGAAPTPEARKAKLLNRYEQHTRHCPACRGRLEKLQALAAAARSAQNLLNIALCVAGGAVGAAAAASAAASSAGVGALGSAVGPAALVTALLAAAWWSAGWLAAAADRWAQEFVFVDYVHAEHD